MTKSGSNKVFESCMADHFVDALRALCAREGGHIAVATAAGCAPHSVYQVVQGLRMPSGKPRGVGRQLREKLDRAFPGWDSTPQKGDVHAYTPTTGGVRTGGDIPALAHQLSQLQPTLWTPQKMRWESLLSEVLPPRFRLTLRDDAMALSDPPSMRRGDWAEFVPAESAEPNQVVLLADRHGNTYVRRYSLKRPGHWLALARHGGFEPLDSIADELRVLAVQVAGGWG